MNTERIDSIRAKMKAEMAVRLDRESCLSSDGMHILVCGVAGCQSSGSMGVYDELSRHLAQDGLEDRIKIISTGCMGLCAQGPLMVTYPDRVMYTHVTKEDVDEIWNSHIKGGKPVERLFASESDGRKIKDALGEHSFYTRQERIALRNCGLIDPFNISEYIGADGYMALEKVLSSMEPEEVIETVELSGIRGRGGAGFPAGRKWRGMLSQETDIKYIACNADEGDPGAFMDRSVLEGDPHSVIEAMTIAGYACGACRGFIYVRAEYPAAVERLRIAIRQAREMGVLGDNILGSAFSFDLEIRLGAGAFVCGEGTALMASIGGRRGEPRPKPPRSSEKGIFERPTVLNNVETFANIPPIILKGADWFKSIGCDRNSGTKVFALGGKIENTGLVEVPMGTTLREIIYDIGGGIPGGRTFKAAQTGGPSGGCIPADLIDTSMDFDSLAKLGAMMGSGGLIVMAEDSCMVDIAKFFLEFTVDESCGKCPPCRIGTKRMLEIFEKITEGKGTLSDIDTLEELSRVISDASLCGLGQAAPNPVLSTIRYFRPEYEAHVVEKKCPAGVCKSMVSFFIYEERCKRCGICKKNCPADAITGGRDEAFRIDNDKCVKCGLCHSKCKFKAILKNA